MGRRVVILGIGLAIVLVAGGMVAGRSIAAAQMMGPAVTQPGPSMMSQMMAPMMTEMMQDPQMMSAMADACVQMMQDPAMLNTMQEMMTSAPMQQMMDQMFRQMPR